MSFTFVDLFAGIGGFHAALADLDAECVFVSEIDREAAEVYKLNWGDTVRLTNPTDPVVHGDITEYAPERGAVRVPKHDLLAAGFPCQPFSKSGAQMGTRDRTRGTLFHNILTILDERRPKLIFLENVRNLAGPRHKDTWELIIKALREIGYKVSADPLVFSPHLLPPALGGSPQVRDRVFILGVYVGPERAMAETAVDVAVPHEPVGEWDPNQWDVARTALPWLDDKPLLLRDIEIADIANYRLSDNETRWISAWDDFVQRLLDAREGERLPGFPIWADDFVLRADLVVPRGTPPWKADFLRKNADFYTAHQRVIDRWLEDWDGLADFPPSRRKLEWQAQDLGSLWDCVLHFRPSGIRAKRPTYLPALVAITQTSIIGPLRRRVTPREAARLQGLPDSFVFGDQSDAASYKQMGNAVHAGAVRYVLREFVRQNARDIPDRIVKSILQPGSVPTPEESARPAGAPSAARRRASTTA